MADQPNKNTRRNQTQQAPAAAPDYKHESDSPLENAKMHPFIKKAMKIGFGVTLFAAIETMAYLFWETWNWDNGDVWDTLYLITLFTPPIIGLCFLKIQRTSKVREDEG